MRSLVLLLSLAVGCGAAATGAGDALDAGADDAGADDAGPDDAGPDDAGSDDAGSDDAGAPDAGCGACQRSLRDRVSDPMAELTATARPGFAVLALRDLDGSALTLEVRRDEEFEHRRRLVLEGDAGWSLEEASGEVFHDMAVHRSGEITLAIERTDRDRNGYELLRLSRRGERLARQELPTAPLRASDVEPGLPNPSWRGRARALGALAQGWLRVVSVGEDLVVLHQSLVDLAESGELVSAVSSLSWSGDAWSAAWTRLVDGRHRVEPPLWAYDDFRFIDVLTRPLLAVDADGGLVVVGRTWTQSRCQAANRLFGEFSPQRCFEEATGNVEARVLPFFFTAFASSGERLGSHAYVPAGGYYYGIHEMAARDGELALVGGIALEDAPGVPRMYPSRAGGPADMVAFDGLVAILDVHDGGPRIERHVDRGRGDLLTAVRWTEAGLIAAGASDWDRGPNGMSVFRGADPLVVFLAPEDGASVSYAAARPSTTRHALAYDIELFGEHIRVAGADDAPITHSGDGGAVAAMTFGGLVLELH